MTTKKRKHSPITLAIINQKGGVGKSTTAVNLAAALGEQGQQVLLVDLDPQGNATSGLGIEKVAGMQSIYDGIIGEVPLENFLLTTRLLNVSIIPATEDLAGAEQELVSLLARENRLADLLGQVKEKYDFILIDCPPSLGLLSINAMVAADSLLIPIQCEYYALEGVTKLLHTKDLVSRLNKELTIYGVLLTMYDGRTSLARQVVSDVQEYFGDLTFKALIPRSVKLAEAPSYGKSILEYAPSSKAAESYRECAKEVIRRA
ncbi:MAG: AAA family ATPase [Coriobacteriales bacterium]|nr:AAA family ATPase [Coriobacteriales bacterium]